MKRRICRVCGQENWVEDPKETWLEWPYPDTGPSGKMVLRKAEGLEECAGCGLVSHDLEADPEVSPEDIREDRYQFPLHYHPGDRNGMRCLKMAALYEKLNSPNSAARWYLYAGIILEKEEEWRKRCFRRALFLLDDVLYEWTGAESAEPVLMAMNLARMLALESVVWELAERYGEELTQTDDRRILEALKELVAEGETGYMSYREMLAWGERRDIKEI